MISIRAGLVYSIIDNSLKKDQFKEIIYYSKFHYIIEDFNLVKQIIAVFNSGIDLDNIREIEFDIDKKTYNRDPYYFNDTTGFVEKYVLEEILNIRNPTKEYDLNEIFSSNGYPVDYEYPKLNYEISIIDDKCDEGVDSDDLELYIEYNRTKNININRIKNAIYLIKNKLVNIDDELISLKLQPFNKDTYGHRNEKKVIDELNELGWDIVPCDNMYIIINGVKINGKPDGYINSGEYAGCYLEVKSKAKISNSDKYQCYTYYGITKKKIILVQSHNNKMIITEMKEKDLIHNWNLMIDDLFRSAGKLIYIMSVNSIEKYEILRKNMKNKTICFK